MSTASTSSSQVPLCFCRRPCQTYSSKAGDVYLKCGARLDYRGIGAFLATIKKKEEREVQLRRMDLGCNLNLKVPDHGELDPRVFALDFKGFPTCRHGLYAKCGVSHSKANDGKTFFSCSVKYPDLDCGYFSWSADLFQAPTAVVAPRTAPVPASFDPTPPEAKRPRLDGGPPALVPPAAFGKFSAPPPNCLFDPETYSWKPV